MRIYTSPWQVAEAGISVVRLDEAVLDQVLLGNHHAHAEIQALQDTDITVEVVGNREAGSRDAAPDLVVLRQALQEQMELGRAAQPPATDLAGTTALWSMEDTKEKRIAAATAEGSALYQPQILMRATKTLSATEALRLARGIGALR